MNPGRPAKETADAREIRLRTVAARLSGIDGIRLADGSYAGPGQAIPACKPLSQWPAEELPGVDEVLDAALQLARTLAEVHRRGVLHLDITPDNVWLRSTQGPAMLAGFEHASTFAPEQPAFTHHREIRRNLAYLAPEQTGRTGRRIDMRADLYALGATLYLAATGRPPFTARDSLQLLRDKLVHVPAAPLELRGSLPPAFSRILLKLLDNDPDNRYQGADGLVYDLAHFRNFPASPDELGRHDHPLQLSAPAQLVGRAAEIQALSQALDQCIRGQGRVLFIGGAPGVGKTSLTNELRPLVTARRGWFVSGKFEQYRQDAPTAPTQALRSLGRLLLAEPQGELAAQRDLILRSLGANAAYLCRVPEFALLLGPLPEPAAADGAQVEARHLAAGVSLLRAMASPARPLVMVLDDLQWAGPLSIRFIEAVMDAPDMPGLLVVGSYRDSDLAPDHPLADTLSRHDREPATLSLPNLTLAQLADFLQAMMRLPANKARELAVAVERQTGGNPYDTVELLNTLRSEGALSPGPGGWHWDEGVVRRHVGKAGVLELISARVARLPPACQSLLRAVACLGGEIRHGSLCAASGLEPDVLDSALLPALEDGVLVTTAGPDAALRLRHDRVQQAIYGPLTQDERNEIHLALARRLAAAGQHAAAAVSQYLPAIDSITDPDEARQVAALLYETARRNRSAANYDAAQRLLALARALFERVPQSTAGDESQATAIAVEHHIALCGLGRFEEADTLYGWIEERGLPVEEWVGAGCAQINSLQNRSRTPEALALGLDLLRRLGLAVPQDFAAADLETRLDGFAVWIRNINLGEDARPYRGDLRASAIARLIIHLSYPAYFTQMRVMAWLILEGHELWVRHGPSPDLVPVLASVGAVAIALNQDFRTGYEATRHLLEVGTRRGWEPGTSEARFLFGAHVGHWFEPLGNIVRQLRDARDSLMSLGELQVACLSCRPITSTLLDCCANLQEWSTEVDAGLVSALHARHAYGIAMLTIDRQLEQALRDESEGGIHALARLGPPAAQPALPTIRLSAHLSRALAAAILGDLPVLAAESSAAMAYVDVSTSYRVAQVRLLHALAQARLAHAAPAGERAGPLALLDADLDWMRQRARDAPINFLHLVKWLQAERAWSAGDFQAAATGFDEATGAVESVARPWHQALITERAGLFHVAHGLTTAGHRLLASALQQYAAWGAAAKVNRMRREHHFLSAGRPGDMPGSSPAASPVDIIDSAAILRASQALSSETSLPRLTARVAEVMGSLCGASIVRLALWDQDIKDWLLFGGQASEQQQVTAADAISQGLLPQSAFRYAERTRQALVVDDVAADDRFSRDPYFAKLARCSLAIIPIYSKSALRALLLLENRQSRSAFPEGRLDAISLIAGQLAVSLENALLYDRLEQRVREQTRELLATARRAGMAQVATNVLHNVGNVLNSVNVSVQLIAGRVRDSRTVRLADVAGLIESGRQDPAGFFGPDGKGRQLPTYLRELAAALGEDREAQLDEIRRLCASVDHIRNVVDMQQAYAKARGILEPFSMIELVEDALRIQADSLTRQGVEVLRDYGDVQVVPLDKTRVMQILVNLIENARQAMEGQRGRQQLAIACVQGDGGITVKVSDNGCGIPGEQMPRMFSPGFTTKPDGHGFGLHSCAVAAREMGGTLSVESGGAGAGASFTLRLPVHLMRPDADVSLL